MEFGVFNICRFRYAKCTLTIPTCSRTVTVTILRAFKWREVEWCDQDRASPTKKIDPQFGAAVGGGAAHRHRQRLPPPDAAAKKVLHRLRLHLLTPPLPPSLS